MEEANKLIGAGRKHLVMGKVVEAVSTLQEACGILAKAYGDTADECAEAFFWCGKALLDLARMENSVLGNALEGVPEGEEDEKPQDSNVESTENVDEKTRDELRVQVYDAMAEKPGDAQKKVEGDKECDVNAGKLEESVADKTEDKEEKTAADKKVEEYTDKMEDSAAQEPLSDKLEEGEAGKKEEKPTDAKVEEPVDKMEDGETDKTGDDLTNKEVEELSEKIEDKTAEIDEADKKLEEPAEKMDEGTEDDDEEIGEDDDVGEKESEEEVGNLQLAWEMLEVAKVIYKRKESKKDQLMAAQAHLRLGEVSAESGNYTQALEDFHECLSLQLKHLDADSRLLAETHYHLGLTFSLNQQYKDAIDELNCSVAVIKSRLENLMQLIAKATGPEKLTEARQEMEELKALLPEIQEKVEDATDNLKTPNTGAVKAALDGASTSSASPASAAQSGDASPANDSTTKLGSANGPAANAPVSDISHLVRKKRKPEESPVNEGVVKKEKQDDVRETRAVQKASGDANGTR